VKCAPNGRLDHAVDHERLMRRVVPDPGRRAPRRQHLFDRHEPARGRHAEQVVEVRVDARYWPLPPASPGSCARARRRGRARHGDQLSPSPPGLRYGDCTVRNSDRGGTRRPETGPGRQERHAPRGRLEPEQEHPLVELAASRSRPPGGRRGSAAPGESSRATRRRNDALDLPARQRRPTSGPAVAHQREVGDGERAMARISDIGLRGDPHRRRRSSCRRAAPPRPRSSDIRLSATDARGYSPDRGSRLSTNASRASSATPERLSSNVKPCSNR